MDSNSRSASPREQSRPQHRPPSPPTPTAFENRAYQHDDADPNHNDSFTSNGPQQNGHTKEPSRDTKTLEAVNLELINLTPKNGNAKKKDAVELDMSTSNPYDEYFVPVNEHRKYMRGEKLYVTADKRGEKGGCKRPLCWTLLALVAAVIVALVVLAATGILFSSSPTTVEQYNSSLSSARAFGGLAHDHSQHDHSQHEHSDHEHDDQNHSMETEPGTLSDEGRSFGGDDSDPSLYVPRTVEGELKIDNEVFTPELRDTESPEYRELTMTFSDALKRALFDRNTIERGDNDIRVEVVKLREGSVIVRYRIHWKPKTGTEVTDDLLTPESLQSNLNNYLARNNRMISTFHIAEDKMSTRQVLDICKISKYDCEHQCVFDENTLDFLCICPPGYILDMTNLKKCVPILGNSNEQETRGIDLNSNPENTKPIPEGEKSNTESVRVSNSYFDWKETSHEVPETTTQPDTDVSFSHIFGNSEETATTKLSTEAKPEPVPAAEPKPEPEPTSKPEPEPESTSKPEPEPEPTSKPEPEPEPTSKPEPEPEPTSKPEPEPEPTSEPKPEAKTASEPKPEPEPEPTSEPAPEPTAQPEPASESSEESNLKVAPLPEPKQQPIAEPVPEPNSEPTPEPNPEPTSEPNAEPTPEPEPNPEPAPEPIVEQESKEHTAVDSTPEPEPKAEPQPNTTHLSISTENPVAEPTAEPEPTTSMPIGDIHFAHNNSSETETELELEPQPKSEPNADLATSSETKSETSNEQNIPVITEHNSMNIESEPTTETDSLARKQPRENENKQDIDESSVTTMRISISEPNIINEPSYEPKPEIISILSDKKFNTDVHETTTNSDWLESGETISNQSSVGTTNNVYEQRSINSIISDLLAESTTEKDNEDKKTDISFLDLQNYDIPTTTAQPSVEISVNQGTTIMTSVSDNDQEQKKVMNIPSDVNTTRSNIEIQKINDTDVTTQDESDITEKKQDNNSEEMSTVYQTQSIKSNESTPEEKTTIMLDPVTEYSIKNQLIDENTSQTDMLLNALTINKTTEISTETTTIINTIDDATDITFDNINKLNQFNRSSKSFERENTSIVESTELQDSPKDAFTTESEWLSVPVTEVNYSQIMDNAQRQATTQMPLTNIEAMINHGLLKDDFEPDYFTSIGSTKATDDVPLYGITHDYDNEDSRVKRVDNITPQIIAKEGSMSYTTEKMEKESNSEVNRSSETTTVSQYIYEVAEQHNSNAPEQNATTTEKTNIINTNPAPVWEESEVDRKAIKETPTSEILINNEMDTITTTTTQLPLTSTTKDIEERNSTDKTIESVMNSTRLNNLSVTVYEVSSHNNSHSSATSNTTNSHSAEYDEHEIDMNPFLPEVENNKHLVKKLQEGHDLELNNLNDTQNDNGEEHSSNVSEGQTSSTINSTNVVINNEGNISTSNENKLNATEVQRTKENKDDSQEPIQENSSTFLEDTEDLLLPEWVSDEYKDSKSKVVPSIDDSKNLSVVPIEQEKLELKALKKDYESKNLQGLNDISDSPKKSDKRTLEVNKLESVINNEA